MSLFVLPDPLFFDPYVIIKKMRIRIQLINPYGSATLLYLGWNKSLLPEEEVVRPPDWKPPTPPRVDIRLVKGLEFDLSGAGSDPPLTD